MPLWRFNAGPNGQRPERDLTGVTGLKVTWSRTTASTVSFSDPNGKFPLEELVDDVMVWCDGQPISRFRTGDTSDSGDEKMRVSTTYAAADYGEVFRRRDIADSATHAWTAADPADALWTLFQQEQARPGSNLGVVRGLRPASGLTIPTFDVAVGDMVSDSADKIAALGASPLDWDIVPTGATGLRLDVWRPRGLNKGVVLHWTAEGNVSSWTRNVTTAQYGNAGRFTGQAPSGGGAAPAAQTIAVADIATRDEGRWSYAESTDQTTTAGLTAAGQASLGDRQIIPVSWSMVLRRGFWQGPGHIWLGDLVQGVVKGGRLNANQLYPVQQIDAEFPNASATDLFKPPKVTITIGAPPKKRASAAASRISALERLTGR